MTDIKLRLRTEPDEDSNMNNFKQFIDLTRRTNVNTLSTQSVLVHCQEQSLLFTQV